MPSKKSNGPRKRKSLRTLGTREDPTGNPKLRRTEPLESSVKPMKKGRETMSTRSVRQESPERTKKETIEELTVESLIKLKMSPETKRDPSAKRPSKMKSTNSVNHSKREEWKIEPRMMRLLRRRGQIIRRRWTNSRPKG